MQRQYILTLWALPLLKQIEAIHAASAHQRYKKETTKAGVTEKPPSVHPFQIQTGSHIEDRIHNA